MKWISTSAVTFCLLSGTVLSIGAAAQQTAASPDIQVQPPASVVSCRCIPKQSSQSSHSLVVHKQTCDSSCECERQKLACSMALAQEQADREANLGRFYLAQGQFAAALATCQEALRLAGNGQAARDCEQSAIKKLLQERRTELSARLEIVDARLQRAEADAAFAELARIRSDLAPPGSPLGDFDNEMNVEITKRLKHAKWLKWVSRGIPLAAWTGLKLIAAALALLVGLYLLRLATNTILRHQRYRTTRLVSDTIDWTVWSIRDCEDLGGAGPVMDALNPGNNPLLRDQLKPSSLLLIPLLAAPDGDEADNDEECPVWRDFLDEPRQAIDMEALPPLSELRRHRFNQMEAFDELDVKLGSIEAKGIVGLFRAVRKWLDRGLPAAQGTVYSMAHGTNGESYACVRITCNWTTELQALAEEVAQPTDGARELDENSPADETVSVYASTANDPSIDAIALSAQKAGFKLFHRLVRKSSPSYATAVANFHQGVKLIDEYI